MKGNKSNMQRHGRWITSCLLLSVITLQYGCGKPQAGGGPQGEMAVSAVVARVGARSLDDTVRLVATLNARDEVSLVSELDATVLGVEFEDGQRVARGDTLFRLSDVVTQARLSEAEAAHRLAEISYRRNEELLKSRTISQQELDQAEATLRAREAGLTLAHDEQTKTRITAPLAGTASESMVSVGQFVTRGRPLLSLVSTDPLEAVADVPERYLPQLRAGLKATFTADAIADAPVAGSVVYLAPALDVGSRTVRVKAAIPNPEGTLRPGMFGKLALLLSTRDDAIVIPESCVRRKGAAAIVVRVNAHGRAEFAPVETGKRFESSVEIISGLAVGDIVVVEGWQKMGPDTPVTAAPASEPYGVPAGSLERTVDQAEGEGQHGAL